MSPFLIAGQARNGLGRRIIYPLGVAATARGIRVRAAGSTAAIV